MKENIFSQINDFYHKKTFDDKWKSDSGNGNKKLDEIQIFLRFLENKREEIESVDFFDKNFKYKENDVNEPGDLEYFGQVYQITHGNASNYENYQETKNYKIKKREAFILPAKDVALPNRERYEYYLHDLNKKENSAKNNIILLMKIDNRDFLDPDSKIKTKWQDIIFVFDEGNVSIKDFS